MMEYDESIENDDESWSAEDDEDDEAEFDDAEASRRSTRASRQHARIQRARTQSNATSKVQGRQYGMVRTPQGNARVELPGKFPTVSEFKATIAQLQADIRANSKGIAQIAERMKDGGEGDAKRCKRVDRQLRLLKAATLIAVTLPTLLEASRPSAARAFINSTQIP